jgi:hypothetical protein
MDTENYAKNKLCPYTMMRNDTCPMPVIFCLYPVILKQLTDFEYSSVQELCNLSQQTTLLDPAL